MDELSEKLAGLLNDPDTMRQVRQMAENILGENSESKEQTTPDISSMLPGEDLGKIISIISQLKNTGNDNRTLLLNALKPHLSEPKREKVDTAIKILRLLELLPLIKDTGLLNL